MEEEIDIFMAQVVRRNPSQPWGFRLEGGYNSGQPLRISAVVPGSPAGSIGLQPGDVITKIFERPTKFVTYQQAADIISAVKNDTLTLTIERSVTGSEPLGDHPQQQQQPHYQHFQPQIHHHQQQPEYQYQPVPAENDNTPTYKGSVHLNLSNQNPTPHVHQNAYHPQMHQPGSGELDSFDSDIPQSRTFRRLQNFMENSQPIGAAALPPPRSAAMEQMRMAQQKAQSQGRMKVIMSQKYNTPLRLYSTGNVIDTFSNQVESILDTLNQE